MTQEIRGFNVTYQLASQTLESKGFLVVNKNKQSIWLKDESKNTVRKGLIDAEIFSDNENFCFGRTLPVAGCKITLGREIIKPQAPESQHPHRQSQKRSINENNAQDSNTTEFLSLDSTPIVSVKEVTVKTGSLTVETWHSSSSSSSSTKRSDTTLDTILNMKPESSGEYRDRSSSSISLRASASAFEPKKKSRPNTFLTCPVSPPKPSTAALPPSGPSLYSACLDEALKKKMRPHQLEAASFLLCRLLGMTIDSDHQGSHSSNHSSTASSSSSIITGAILADDVGTGKSLTSLSVLWALVRKGRAKGLVLCPSSLVSHWEREIKRWLPLSLAKTALYAYSGVNNRHGSPNAIVGYFLRNPPEVHPLLVMSYELYRNFSDALNSLEMLEVLVCDEGHRLKNAYGTKTSNALVR